MAPADAQQKPLVRSAAKAAPDQGRHKAAAGPSAREAVWARQPLLQRLQPSSPLRGAVPFAFRQRGRTRARPSVAASAEVPIAAAAAAASAPNGSAAAGACAAADAASHSPQRPPLPVALQRRRSGAAAAVPDAPLSAGRRSLADAVECHLLPFPDPLPEEPLRQAAAARSAAARRISNDVPAELFDAPRAAPSRRPQSAPASNDLAPLLHASEGHSARMRRQCSEGTAAVYCAAAPQQLTVVSSPPLARSPRQAAPWAAGERFAPAGSASARRLVSAAELAAGCALEESASRSRSMDAENVEHLCLAEAAERGAVACWEGEAALLHVPTQALWQLEATKRRRVSTTRRTAVLLAVELQHQRQGALLIQSWQRAARAAEAEVRTVAAAHRIAQNYRDNWDALARREQRERRTLAVALETSARAALRGAEAAAAGWLSRERAIAALLCAEESRRSRRMAQRRADAACVLSAAEAQIRAAISLGAQRWVLLTAHGLGRADLQRRAAARLIGGAAAAICGGVALQELQERRYRLQPAQRLCSMLRTEQQGRERLGAAVWEARRLLLVPRAEALALGLRCEHAQRVCGFVSREGDGREAIEAEQIDVVARMLHQMELGPRRAITAEAQAAAVPLLLSVGLLHCRAAAAAYANASAVRHRALKRQQLSHREALLRVQHRSVYRQWLAAAGVLHRRLRCESAECQQRAVLAAEQGLALQELRTDIAARSGGRGWSSVEVLEGLSRRVLSQEQECSRRRVEQGAWCRMYSDICKAEATAAAEAPKTLPSAALLPKAEPTAGGSGGCGGAARSGQWTGLGKVVEEEGRTWWLHYNTPTGRRPQPPAERQRPQSSSGTGRRRASAPPRPSSGKGAPTPCCGGGTWFSSEMGCPGPYIPPRNATAPGEFD
eukprot:TRINITY_DN55314_c0_g1_i1.p1 TRINITY_DN55314_c0_g1~~TRINITY_DN55314_c0_g1_i1.p1  ORF type:complete len:925 (+),score=241.23 TRINITY_DN55314_c0_g1_i1:77-2776(+)